MKKILLIIGTLLITGCAATPPRVVSSCDNSDGKLSNIPFVFVEYPISGNRVSPGFSVEGCSRTFESTVNWRVYDRYGHTIAEGHTMGGGVDGFADYSFVVDYQVSEDMTGWLVVYDDDQSDGEGNPTMYNDIPLILLKE